MNPLLLLCFVWSVNATSQEIDFDDDDFEPPEAQYSDLKIYLGNGACVGWDYPSGQFWNLKRLDR